MSSQLTKPSQFQTLRRFDRDSFAPLVQRPSSQRIFSRNTIAHIVLPAVLGASLAGMLTYIDFKVEGQPIIPPPQGQLWEQKPQEKINLERQHRLPFINGFTRRTRTSYYLTYGTASILASSLVTLFLVGLPENESDRRRAWLIASVGAITLPLTMSTLLSFSTQIEAANQQAQRAKEKAEEVTEGYLDILDQKQNSNDISDKILLAPARDIVEDSQEVIREQSEETSIEELDEKLDEIKEIDDFVSNIEPSAQSNDSLTEAELTELKVDIEDVKEKLEAEIESKIEAENHNEKE